MPPPCQTFILDEQGHETKAPATLLQVGGIAAPVYVLRQETPSQDYTEAGQMAPAAAAVHDAAASGVRCSVRFPNSLQCT